ncbi:MAG: transaldolase family protein [Candidatus Babeliales bacterium]
MKLFIDTSNLHDIKRWYDMGILDGVTTNPTNLSKEGGDPKKHIQEMCALMKDHDISVEVTEADPQLVYKQAKAIAALAKNVVVKIPCHRDYYAVINKLVQEGVALNITLVFTVLQGMLMAKMGVRYISPFVGRWDDIDVDGNELIHEMRSMIDDYCYQDTAILAASLRTVRDVHNAVINGADVATLPSSLLEKITDHPLTNRGIELFTEDWKKLGIKQFP